MSSQARKLTRFVALILPMLIVASPGWAQRDQLKVPHLNGHRFIPSDILADPFMKPTS